TKSDHDSEAARGPMSKKAIEKADAPYDPRPCARKSDPGNEEKVDRREDRNIVLTACGRQNRDDFAAAPAQVRAQWRDLRFVRERFEDDNHSGPLPNRQLEHAVTDF